MTEHLSNFDGACETFRAIDAPALKARIQFLSKTLSAQHLAENDAMDAAAGDGLALNLAPSHISD